MSGLDMLMDALLRARNTDEAVAVALNVSVGMARNRRLALGLPAQSQRRRPKDIITPERAERANDMRYDGAKPEQIARELGVSRRTVYRMLRDEIKVGAQVLTAATRQRKAAHMRRIQPLGAEAWRRR